MSCLPWRVQVWAGWPAQSDSLSCARQPASSGSARGTLCRFQGNNYAHRIIEVPDLKVRVWGTPSEVSPRYKYLFHTKPHVFSQLPQPTKLTPPAQNIRVIWQKTTSVGFSKKSGRLFLAWLQGLCTVRNILILTPDPHVGANHSLLGSAEAET